MGFLTVQPITISKIPNASTLLLPNPKPSFPLRKLPAIRTAAQLSRSICLRNVLSKATSSEESSSGANHAFDEKCDSVIVLDEVQAVDKKGFNEIDPKQKFPVEEQEGTSSEESSSLENHVLDEKRDGIIVLDEVEAVDKKGVNEIDPKQKLPVEEQEGTSYEESSSGANHIFDEKREGIIVLDEVEAVDKKGFNEIDPKQKFSVEEQEGTSSEESSIAANHILDEKRDGTIVFDEVEAVDKKGFNEIDPKQKLPVEEQEGTSLNALDNLNIKFDADDTGSVVFYAGGAVLALWLTSSVIGAIDSIPLFPKVFEVVGLGYTIWFTSRYLIFKKNRDELIAKIEVLKEQVLGSED